MNEAKTRALKLDMEGKCLICEKVDADRRRGLCMRHYQQMRAATRGLRDDQIQKLEDVAIENGHLMPSAQGKRASSHNVFSDYAEAIRIAEDRRDYETTSDEQKPSEPTHPTAADVDSVVRSGAKKAVPKADPKTASTKKKKAE